MNEKDLEKEVQKNEDSVLIDESEDDLLSLEVAPPQIFG